MEHNLIKRRPQWKMTLIYGDLNGRQPQWKTTSMEEASMEDDIIGRQPQWKITSNNFQHDKIQVYSMKRF